MRADIGMGGEGKDSARLRRRRKGGIGAGIRQRVWRRQVGVRGARRPILRVLSVRVAQLADATLCGPIMADEAAAALVPRKSLGSAITRDSGIGGDRDLHLAEDFTGPLKQDGLEELLLLPRAYQLANLTQPTRQASATSVPEMCCRMVGSHLTVTRSNAPRSVSCSLAAAQRVKMASIR